MPTAAATSCCSSKGLETSTNLRLPGAGTSRRARWGRRLSAVGQTQCEAVRLRSSRSHQSKGSGSVYGKNSESSGKQDQQGDQRGKWRRGTQVSGVRRDLYSRGFLGGASQPGARGGWCLSSRSAHSRPPRPSQRDLDGSAQHSPTDNRAANPCTRAEQPLGRREQWNQPRRPTAVHLPEGSSSPGRGDPASECLAGRSRAIGPDQVTPATNSRKPETRLHAGPRSSAPCNPIRFSHPSDGV